MDKNKFTVEILEEPEGNFWVRCEQMKFSSYTKNPENLVDELFREWFGADMGEAFVPTE